MSFDVRGKNVFISGPMTGYPHHNVTAFLEAHELLVRLGAGDIYDPALEYYKELERKEIRQEHEYYMRKCVYALTCSDAFHEFRGNHWDVMVQLEGWRDSEGCVTEKSVADACGILAVEIGEVDGKQDE